MLEKARVYDALQSGERFDEDDRYHVVFRAGGQLPDEAGPSVPQLSWANSLQSASELEPQRAGCATGRAIRLARCSLGTVKDECVQ